MNNGHDERERVVRDESAIKYFLFQFSIVEGLQCRTHVLYHYHYHYHPACFQLQVMM